MQSQYKSKENIIQNIENYLWNFSGIIHGPKKNVKEILKRKRNKEKLTVSDTKLYITK